mmetsp:Transcript_38477/g.49789  ORF Transcript_38477/g.49789 Transcript_38477/m.49789 type:complete len:134 (+) Transcript_38477:127-528(+)
MKLDVISRLKSGGFKLVDGELRWRDGENANGEEEIETWYDYGDPRNYMNENKFLSSLLTIGNKIKSWKWNEYDRPIIPNRTDITKEMIIDNTFIPYPSSLQDDIDDGVDGTSPVEQGGGWAAGEMYSKQSSSK